MQPLGNFLREFLYLQSKFADILRFRFLSAELADLMPE